MPSIEVCMPNYGMSMEEGEIAEWFKQEGDSLAKGDDLVEIIENKANRVIEAPEAGTLEKIVVPEGESAAVGAVIGIIAT